MGVPTEWWEEYGWSECTPSDRRLLKEQIGREPRSVLAVARRCRYGSPQVIVNNPLPLEEDGRPRPFPTLFWLTCSHLVSGVSALEAEGWIGTVRERLRTDQGLARAMSRAHADHAAMRLALGDHVAIRELRARAPEQHRVLAETGVGGIVASDGVKCLHTHLADYLGRRHRTVRDGSSRDSGVNRIGAMTAELLLQRGVDLDGNAGCRGCPAGAVCNALRSERRPVTAIDIGSNSIRLLRCVWNETTPQQSAGWAVEERRRVTTRLGAGSGFGEALSEEAVSRSLAALKEFAAARGAGEVAPVAGATAAVRRSARPGAFLRRLWEETGISAPVIAEEDEARLAFLGAVKGLGRLETGGECAVLDIGGGSTEVAFGTSMSEATQRTSLPIGAVVGKEHFLLGDPASDRELQALRRSVSSLIDSKLTESVQRDAGCRVIAVGGTATSAAAVHLGLEVYDPDLVHGTVLKTGAVGEMLQQLAALDLEKRRLVKGLEPERADVIVAGLVVLQTLLERLNADSVIVSEADVLQGLLWENFGPHV